MLKYKDNFVIDYNPEFYLDTTLLLRLSEWLENFKENYETMKFRQTIHDLPKIKESALIIDHPFSGSFDKQVEDLKDYKGTIFVCDRALRSCIINEVIPDYVVNVDSSFLCLAFFDLPEIRKHMDKITALFGITTFPLTIRAWTGKKAFFTPDLGSNYGLTETLSARSKTDILKSGGCVHNSCWGLAYAMGAKVIGLYGIDNSYDKLGQAEHGLDVKSQYVKELERTFYVDPVYRLYAGILFSWIESIEGEVKMVNTTENGIMYNSVAKRAGYEIDIKKMPLKKFVGVYK